MRRWLVSLVALSAALFLLGSPSPALAHWADQSVAEVVVGSSSVHVTLTLPATLLPGTIEGPAATAAYFRQHLILAGDGSPGIARVDGLGAPEDGRLSTTHRTVALIYSWPKPIATLTIRYDLFPAGVPAANCLATIIRGGKVQTFIFTPQQPIMTLGSGWTGALARVSSFIVLGIEHIFTGYDHILFLLSLLLLGGTLRGLLKIVSAFTAAHSITLSLAALNVVSLPGRWVESAIALSIVIVAAENVLRSDLALRQRWAVTFTFGLVHGLGFASVLRDLDLPRSSLVSSLVGFNLGVEIGQVVIVAAAYALLRLLARWPRAPQARRWVSAVAAAVGLVWFVQRALLG